MYKGKKDMLQSYKNVRYFAQYKYSSEDGLHRHPGQQLPHGSAGREAQGIFREHERGRGERSKLR